MFFVKPGFETKEACEQAYFKMDNALIDDRRIHVGFSQSVAKLLSQYRRKDNQPAGRGCFKCGSPDHMARDCTGDPANKHHPLKNILKDDDMQHGGDNNSRKERNRQRVTEIGDMERTNDVLKVKEVNILGSDLIEKSIWIEEKNEEMEEETMEITERKIQIVKEGGDDHKDDQDYRREVQIVIEIMIAIKRGMSETIDIEVQNVTMIVSVIETGVIEMTKVVEL
ncbi:hypothetical protein H0E87_014416 [Populus deltoides]|uniref:CCHC-type domain-containing protein n=1 Tax=Populus deltoides TaxID=3696 RepID=A0A8T2YDF0_POPDE|nr:hypothetical protein H0E87_014416 [Populus deltoides]